MKKVALLDTNVLLHSIPLRQIDWARLLGADEVELVICPAVADELEDKKYDPQHWLQDRARKANAQIQDHAAPNNEAGSGVRLVLTHAELDSEALKARKLVWNRGDDRILGCALAYHEGDKTGIVIVSRDNAFLNRAGTQGFAILRLDDKYLLPAAPDPLEAKIKLLEAQLKKYREQFPKLSLTFADGNSEATAKLHDQDPQELAGPYLLEWGRALAQTGINATADDAARFHQFATQQGEAEEVLGRMETFRFVVRNEGHHPAHGVRVKVDVPREIEANPRVEFPPDFFGERHPLDEVARIQHFNRNRLLKEMTRFTHRPIRVAPPDPSATPGVEGPFVVPNESPNVCYVAHGDIKDRATAKFPEIIFLFGKDAPERVVLKYEIVASEVPGSFTGELTINVKRSKTAPR